MHKIEVHASLISVLMLKAVLSCGKLMVMAVPYCWWICIVLFEASLCDTVTGCVISGRDQGSLLAARDFYHTWSKKITLVNHYCINCL